MQDLIPQEKGAAVSRGLREAFGVTEFEDIQRITKGRTSALVLRIVVKGTAFLLRIIRRPNAMIGPERHFTCMRLAADAGLAPQVRYISIEDELSITDFVDETPFPAKEALVRIPAALRTLHSLAPFPGVENRFNTTCMFLIHQGPARDEFIQKIQASDIFSKVESEQLFAWHAQVAEVYRRLDPDMVSSHNDLFKPDNILFDGGRVWLVDWEAAFLNDRYADLAVVANQIVTNDAEEREYLREYFGAPPTLYQLARFFLMRQIAHMFYAMVFLSMGSAGEPKALEFGAFRRRMWAGDVQLVDNETKFIYGRFHWEQLVEDMRGGRFREALGIVSERHPLSR